MLALPAAAAANLDGGGGKWAPGQIIIRFYDRVGTAARERIVNAAGVRLEYELPLVRNLWEVQTNGKVEDALRRISAEPGVEYSEPDYVESDQPDAAPTARGYWPNNPYFWPAKRAAIQYQFGVCPRDPEEPESTQDELASWGMWPTGVNLTDSTVLADKNVLAPGSNPLPAKDQVAVAGGKPKFANYWGIDVLPAWNMLRDVNRLSDPPGHGLSGTQEWQGVQIRREGVAVDDTGLSSNPDLHPEVAALWSIGRSADLTGASSLQLQARQRVREVYADDPERGQEDLQTVTTALRPRDQELVIENARRALFTLDDVQVLDPAKWEPPRHGDPKLPVGCDGHGTGVGSLIGGRGNSGKGIAGVGYDVPLVGFRVAEPWDKPGTNLANNNKLGQARTAWTTWKERASFTESDAVIKFAMIKALRIPILNMSYGAPMFFPGVDGQGRAHPVVVWPARVEALADLFTSGTTLGIAAAGNHSENYGTGGSATGIHLYPTGEGANRQDGVSLPCGLRLIPKLGVRTAAGAPFVLPGINWRKLELICVAATSSKVSQLTAWSGRGNAAVQMAAPGADITLAARPAKDFPNIAPYFNSSGTSFAAPMVAGAASLLRRAAIGAGVDDVRRALEQGARRTVDLSGPVQYGQLDVACSLRWLLEHRRPGWDALDLNRIKTEDPEGYTDFYNTTSQCGANARPPSASVSDLSVAKTKLFGPAEPFDNVQLFINHLGLEPGPDSNSIRWQGSLGAAGPEWANARAVFQIGGGATRPVAPPARPVYFMGLLTAGCPQPGYHITQLKFRFVFNLLEPQGAWAVPTDKYPPLRQIQVAIAVAKPWYSGLLGSQITVRATARCEP